MERIALVLGGQLISNHKYENVSIYDLVTFEEAVKRVKKIERDKSSDIIISPAGTAVEIENYATLPIVKTDISDFDILETIFFAESDSKAVDKNIALIMHESKDICLDRFKPLLKNNLYFYKYSNEDYLRHLVMRLSRKNIDIIIGGPTTIKYSHEYGIKGYILRLTDESIQLSINKAKESLTVSSQYKLQNQLFKTAISLFSDGIIITNELGIITNINLKAAGILNENEDKIMGRNIAELINYPKINILNKGYKDKIIECNGHNLFLNMKHILIDSNIKGAIISLKEANTIEELGHRYREYQSKGFTAKYNFADIMGSSKEMKEVIRIAKSYADVDSDILINGETGTGKELFAQSIHNYSNRRKGPFVALNCAALPENLLESELMGYEEGAFTGAKRGGKAGMFELAHTGTIFLDEINQLPVQLQSRILRVLQERQIHRLGGDRIVNIDVRVISAANENLYFMTNEGEFRRDLYYRLSVLNLNIPPLRERTGDISLLIKYYFDIFSELYGNSIPFDRECIKLLENYVWPGNIRELMNIVERYIVISRNTKINPLDYVKEYLKNINSNNNGKIDMNQIVVNMSSLKEMEEQIIGATIKRYNNNKKQAAMALGISRTTLWKKFNNE